MLFSDLTKIALDILNKYPSSFVKGGLTARKRVVLRTAISEKYNILLILRKKLKLGKIRFQINTTQIGSAQIFSGFKIVLPSATTGSSADLNEIYNSLHTSFVKNWHKNLFRFLMFVCSFYLFYSFIGTVFLQLFFWDNTDFTPLIIKYPGILNYPTLHNYFFPSPAAVVQPSQRFPMEFLAIFALDI